MLILRLSKREDQALIWISTILKFSAQEKHIVPPVTAPCPDEPISSTSSLVSREYERSWSRTCSDL